MNEKKLQITPYNNVKIKTKKRMMLVLFYKNKYLITKARSIRKIIKI